VGRLELMRVFVAVAESESFAGAARKLGISAPVVTRSVSSLEELLGVQLLHRTTRQVRLTEAGLGYLADCHRILSEVEEAEASASGFRKDPRGVVSVTAPVLFGRMFVAPLLLEFTALYPDVSVRALFLDRVVDLIEEGLDVAIRISHLESSSLHATQVGAVRRVVCASPAYLAKHGAPKEPSALMKHEVVSFSSSLHPMDWLFESKGQEEVIRPNARISVNSAEVAISMALAGRGLVRVLSYQVAHHLASGELVRVLTEYETPPTPIYVVYHSGKVPSQIRVFISLAVERLRSLLKESTATEKN
jgi:DNA-binding transcriptional LysR family regulator